MHLIFFFVRQALSYLGPGIFLIIHFTFLEVLSESSVFFSQNRSFNEMVDICIIFLHKCKEKENTRHSL